jgi:anti-sigma-K factor RskA
MVSEKNLEATMEVRTTFRGTAASKKGFGVVLLAVIVAIVAMLAIALASAGSAKPSAAPAIASGTFVGSAALADRESGQPMGSYVEPANGHGALP